MPFESGKNINANVWRPSFGRYFFCALLVCAPLPANFRTCEELMKIISGEAASFRGPYSGTPIVWPKSLISEKNYQNVVKEKIDPFYMAAEKGVFVGKGDIALPFRVYKNQKERAVIVVVPGMMEDPIVHKELIYNLYQEGYTVHAVNHRGQGHADRLALNSQIAHVEKFNDFVEDLGSYIHSEITFKTEKPIYVVAYSMGGLVSVQLNDQAPRTFDALIAAAPPFSINLGGIPKWMAKKILERRIKTQGATAYAPSMKDGDVNSLDFRTASWDEVRNAVLLQDLQRDPGILMGGPSNGHVLSLLEAGDGLDAIAKRSSMPLLLLQAGDDRAVNPNAIHRFAKHAPFASYLNFPDSRHSIFREKDDVRNVVMSEIYRYLIHPERLDSPPAGAEVERLVSDSKNYLNRGEIALAQYAIDEALRTLEWKKRFVPKWQDEKYRRELWNQSEDTNDQLNASPAGTRAFYLFLAYRRSQEMDKLYPTE